MDLILNKSIHIFSSIIFIFALVANIIEYLSTQPYFPLCYWSIYPQSAKLSIREAMRNAIFQKYDPLYQSFYIQLLHYLLVTLV